MKYLAAVSAISLLAACGQSEAPTPAADAPEPVAETPEATVETASADTAGLCLESGPQTPRDIASTIGLNSVTFPTAPPASEMNLCNIHTHTNAEHKGPGFSVFVDDTDSGGYACNGTADLTEAELAPADGAYQGVKPGDTIEVHWVHTTCEATPGEGLGACVPEGCSDPLLRVEAQTFLVVNDENALD
ncbi:MAG: delta-class carbonic anhydrase, partial [Pseudomonadota bacterium]